MFSFLRDAFGRKAPLSGAPQSRREKNYSADSGYVYQYTFEGFREKMASSGSSFEYVFRVTADRTRWFELSVLLSARVLGEWASAPEGRELGSSERFGVVKLALRRAFDRAPSPSDLHGTVEVDGDELGAIAAELDLI
jgi:hypothetical protein